jgi:hypothetical protein
LDVSWLVRRLTDKLDKSSQSSDLYSSHMFWLNIIFACAYGSAGMGGGETVAGLTALNFAVSHSNPAMPFSGLPPCHVGVIKRHRQMRRNSHGKTSKTS